MSQKRVPETNQNRLPYSSRLHPRTIVRTAIAAVGLTVALSACSSSPPASETSPSPSPSVETTQASPSASVSPSPTGDANKSSPTQRLEAALVNNLSRQLGMPVKAVNCPNQDKLDAGTSFDCTTQLAEGSFPVNVTMKDSQGRFSLKTKQLIVLSKVEGLLQQAIKQQNSLEVKADCGGKVKFFQKPGETFKCTLTNPNGKTGSATVTVTNEEGNVDAKWNVPS